MILILITIVLFVLGVAFVANTKMDDSDDYYLCILIFGGQLLFSILTFKRYVNIEFAVVLAVVLIFLSIIIGSVLGVKSPKESNTTSISQDNEKFEQLICFISFAKRIKPLTGGNYGIYISYEAPGQSEYTSRLYATLGFYDFDEIGFAREYAIGSSSAPVNMIQHYYESISERAGLNQQDWPYGIDASDFADVLRGTFCESYFTLIPDEYNDDIFTFKVVGGIDSRNAVQVSNAVINVLKSNFPELQISKNHTTPYSMGIKIQI